MTGIKLRIRQPDEEKFGNPVPVPFIAASHLPREGEQFITPEGRAFAVTLVERRYDISEVHLFCVEYPKEEAPRRRRSREDDAN